MRIPVFCLTSNLVQSKAQIWNPVLTFLSQSSSWMNPLLTSWELLSNLAMLCLLAAMCIETSMQLNFASSLLERGVLTLKTVLIVTWKTCLKRLKLWLTKNSKLWWRVFWSSLRRKTKICLRRVQNIGQVRSQTIDTCSIASRRKFRRSKPSVRTNGKLPLKIYFSLNEEEWISDTTVLSTRSKNRPRNSSSPLK